LEGYLHSFFQFLSATNEKIYSQKVSERLDHHPNNSIIWKAVKLSLKSFDVDAITKRDITLGKEIDRIKS
jgi:pterin-4a-carbinolamine dehydratase